MAERIIESVGEMCADKMTKTNITQRNKTEKDGPGGVRTHDHPVMSRALHH